MEKEVLFSHYEDGFKSHHTLTAKPSLQNFAFRSHSHNMYELFLFLNGNGDFVVEGNVVTLERGSLIFTLCGQTHNLLLRSDAEPYERIVIMFSEKYLPKECDELLKKASGCGCVSILSENEISWFKENINILQSGSTQSIKNILSHSIINLAIHKIAVNSAVSGDYDAEDDIVKQIIMYINRNLSEKISLDTLAKALFRDKAYLGRCFKEVMGCSIWEYIIRKRIFSAREQLYLTQSISDAFSSSGFGDYSAFYRKYKKLVGRSPSEDLKVFKEQKF